MHFSLYSFAFINTMSQYHPTADGIPGWDQLDNPAGSTQAPKQFLIVLFPWFWQLDN